jgi:hypothetical protein
MRRIGRHVSREKNSNKEKCGIIRFLVVILSLISLINRIIYSTYASWLALTTYDCIPCANSTSSNDSYALFVSHHSSAIFNTIRDFNIKNRAKRFAANASHVEHFLLSNDSYKSNSTLISNEQKNGDKFREEYQGREDFKDKIIVHELKVEQNLNDEKSYSDEWAQAFKSVATNDVPNYSREESIDHLFNMNEEKDSNMTHINKEYDNKYVSNISLVAMESQPLKKESKENIWEDSEDSEDYDMESNSMTKRLKEQEFNESKNSLKDLYSKRLQKSLKDYQVVNDSSYVSSKENKTKNLVIQCSEECAVFLTVELNDPMFRKWAIILITIVLYFYALIMFCIFIGVCFAFVEMLIIATFIEGAKLFAGFILMIIDSFNGIIILNETYFKLKFYCFPLKNFIQNLFYLKLNKLFLNYEQEKQFTSIWLISNST